MEGGVRVREVFVGGEVGVLCFVVVVVAFVVMTVAVTVLVAVTVAMLVAMHRMITPAVRDWITIFISKQIPTLQKIINHKNTTRP